MIVPVHNHSEYSALDGLSRPSEIADRCAELGCPCCGLTDHGVVSGHLEFAKALDKHGIKPIFGCEFYHGTKTEFGRQERDQAHFVAGAITDEGLKNLWRLADESSKPENFRFVGRINWDACERFSEGMFATSACIQGLVPKGILNDDFTPLNRYLDIYGENFYIELHTYPGAEHEELNLALAQVATERGLPVIYADDAHFAFPDQYETHDAYVAKSTGDSIYTPIEDRKMWHPKSLYIKSEDEVRKALSYLPESLVDEAIQNSVDLGERVDAQLPAIRRHLPVFIPEECKWYESKQSASELFIDLVAQGLEDRYGMGYSDEIFERAEREMEVFLEAGLEHYFLLAWDVAQFCDHEGIVRGPGRGSAGGCIVAYALGITDVDPLRYDLIFERFYNPGREKGFPDIDSDFPRKDRKRVKKYLEDKWGKDRVRSIGTVTRMKPIAALNATYNACGVTFKEKEVIKELVETVPDLGILGSDSIGWSEGSDPGKTIYVMDHIDDKIEAWIEKQPEDRRDFLYEWIFLVDAVCSRVENYGIHPSGIVISDEDLPAIAPCAARGPAGEKIPATQFPMDVIDELQLIKLDVLGLRTLDTLQEWEDLVDFDVEWSGLETQYDDHEMWKLLDKGLGLGIFQIEDGYGKRLCKDFQPRNVEDLAVVVALNRPGPIRSGAPDSFITRRNGGTDEEFDGRNIPILADILEPTYGWFLYQEQVIRFFGKLGYNESEADAVRKILGKKKPEQMRALRNGEGEWEGHGFYEAADSSGLTPSLAEEIWSKLEDFAKYSFNKSHAIAYAVLGFRCLYAKYTASAEFFIACLKTNPEDSGKYIAEARRMGIKMHPPHIEKSEPEPTVVDNDVYLGFSDVKGVRSAGKYITVLRKKGCGLSTPEALDDALDKETEVWEQEKKELAAKGKKIKRKSPRQSFGRDKIEKLFDAGAWDELGEREIALSKKQELEKELLGVILSDENDRILADNEEAISECDLYSDLEEDEEATLFKLPGIISQATEKLTKANKQKMGIVTIEYGDENVEFVVFPRQWKSHKFLWKERTPGLFTLERTDRGIHFEDGIRLS